MIQELGPKQKEWVRRLKAHPERQGVARLGRKRSDGSYTACCLGEGGLMLGTCGFTVGGKLRETASGDISYLGKTYTQLGLISKDGRTHHGLHGEYESLATLNDDYDTTWVDIAYMMEAVPELFFIRPV